MIFLNGLNADQVNADAVNLRCDYGWAEITVAGDEDDIVNGAVARQLNNVEREQGVDFFLDGFAPDAGSAVDLARRLLA